MAELKYQWLKEVAVSFGLDICQLAKTMGYTRQALYQIGNGSCKGNEGRLNVAIHKLHTINANLYEVELKTAKENYVHRIKLIDGLHDRLSG